MKRAKESIRIVFISFVSAGILHAAIFVLLLPMIFSTPSPCFDPGSCPPPNQIELWIRTIIALFESIGYMAAAIAVPMLAFILPFEYMSRKHGRKQASITVLLIAMWFLALLVILRYLKIFPFTFL